MNRLQSELTRLYPRPDGPERPVRAMVLELSRPPAWEPLSRVWEGVQAELGLPAPAIAVSGTDGLQLWFSLAEPVAPERALQFLAALRQRFMPDVDAGRVRALTQLPQVPAEQGGSGNWSAFVAPDLAPVFDDAPWLDIPPNHEGQATLLAAVAVTKAPLFEAAMGVLGGSGQAEVAAPKAAGGAPGGSAVDATDPARFLQQVMQDGSVPLALRIEAAKALLRSGPGR